MNFHNRKDVEEWLESKPLIFATTIGARAAMRLVPYFVGLLRSGDHKHDRFDVTLRRLRCNLSASIASIRPTETVREAAAAAAAATSFDHAGYPDTAVKVAEISAIDPDAVVFISDAASTVYTIDVVVKGAADAASASAGRFPALFAPGISARAAAWRSVSRDADIISEFERPEYLIRSNLWADGDTPEYAANIWTEFKTLLQEHGSFDFWIRWYEGFLNGDPLNWDIQEKVALLPDDDWAQGPAHIEGKIRDIEAEYLAALAPLAERMEINPETGRLRVVPIPMAPAAHYQTTLDSVRDEISDIWEQGIGNQYAALEREGILKRLDRALTKYAENPQRVHDDFLRSANSIAGLIDKSELASDTTIDALSIVLRTGADDIRAAIPEVAEAVKRRMELRIREARAEEIEALVVGTQIADISEGVLEEELREDDEDLNKSRDKLSPENTEIALDAATVQRLGSRFSQAYRLLSQKLQTGGRVFKGLKDGVGAAELLMKLGKAIAAILEWFD